MVLTMPLHRQCSVVGSNIELLNLRFGLPTDRGTYIVRVRFHRFDRIRLSRMEYTDMQTDGHTAAAAYNIFVRISVFMSGMLVL